MVDNIRKRKSIMLIVGIVLITLLIGVGFYLSEHFNDENDLPVFMDQDDYYEFVFMLEEKDVSQYDEELIEEIYLNHPDMLAELENESPVYYHFINGMMMVHDYDENAEYELEKCLDELNLPYYRDISDEDSYTNSNAGNIKKQYTYFERNIAARCYYEIMRIAIDYNEYIVINRYEENIEAILATETNVYYNILLYTWHVSDVMAMPAAASKASELADKLIELSELCDYGDKSILYSTIAYAYLISEKNVKYMDYELLALQEAEENNDVYNQIISNCEIGYQYFDEGNIEKAREYLLQAYSLKLEDEQEDAELKSYTASILANLNLKQKNNLEAEKYISEMEGWIEKEAEGDIKRDDYTNYLLLKAEYEYLFGSCNEAINYLDETKERFVSAKNFLYNNFDIDLYNLYGKVYYKLDQYKDALDYYEKVYQITEERGMEKNEITLEGLYKSYAKMNDLDKSMYYSEELIDELNRRLEDKSVRDANYLLEEFNSDKKDSQISSLETKQRRYIMVFVIILLVFIIGGYQIWAIRRNNKRITYLSERDGLTSLYNRRKLDEYLSKNWIRLKKNKASIVMVDVDMFKQYNDNYGHQKGDNVLVSLAEVFRNNADEDDFLARYGGEEFLLVLTETDDIKAEEKIKGIYDSISKMNISHEYSSVADRITISVGYATFDEKSDESYEQAIQRADKALYIAKKSRNEYAKG